MAVTRSPAFRGRTRECEALDRLLDRARAGESAVLVIRGEAGIGKTALMNYCAGRASDCRVAQIAGVEAELAMPFASLSQLCDPMMEWPHCCAGARGASVAGRLRVDGWDSPGSLFTAVVRAAFMSVR